MKKTIVIIAIILNSCISINNLTPKYTDDGTSILTESDKNRIYKFDEYFPINKQDSLSFKFEYLKAENYIELTKRSKYSWFIFYAPWCGHSGILLQRNSNQLKQDLYSKFNLKIYLVSQSSDINSMQNMLWSNNIIYPSYILDPKEFGFIESNKIPNFANKIYGSARQWSTGSPHCIVTDNNLNLIAYSRSDKTNLDTILKYIKIYESNK